MPPTLINGLTAKSVAPSPGPEWLLPPYKFTGSVVLSAGTSSSTFIPIQTLTMSSFKYIGPVVSYGSGNSGTGADNIAGLTYNNGYWRVYDNQGREVNYKAEANITTGPNKLTGTADGWVAGSVLAGDPVYLFLKQR